MPGSTDNHDFQLFADGESGWEHRFDLRELEVAVMVRDTDANKVNYTSHDGAFYLATDTGDCYLGDGTSWNKIGTIAESDAGSGSGGRTTLRATDYGADPTGTDPSTVALQDAINDAEPGDRVVWGEAGTYYLDNEITITKRVEVDLYEGTIESDYTDGGTYNDQNHYWPLFRIRGAQGSSTTLSQAHDRGDDQIHVNDPSLFAEGDGIVIRNNDTTRPTVPGYSYQPTCSRIREIQNGVLYLEDELEADYATGEYATYADYLKRPILKNVTVHPRTEPAFDSDAGKVLGGPRHIVATEYCDKPRIENVEAESYDSHLWTGYDDRNATVVDCTAIKPMNLSGSCGEPFVVHGSSNPTLVRPVARGCRRGIDLRSGASKVTVLEPTITGISLVGASWHSSSDVQSDMHVVGGRFDCRPTDDTMENKDGSLNQRQELQRGQAFLTGVNTQFTAVGTRFVTRINSVINGKADILNSEIYKFRDVGTTLTLSGEDIHLTGTEISSSGPVAQLLEANSAVSNVALTEVTFDCSGNPERAILLDSGSHIDINGHITDGATYAPIDISGGEDISINCDMVANSDYAAIIGTTNNVSISGRIEGSCANEVIQIDSGTNISIDCNIDASSGSAVRGVRIFAPEEVSITGSYTGPGQAVRFSGDATNVVVHDMRIDVTDGTQTGAIRVDSSPTALTMVKLINNDLRGAVDTIVSDVDVNGLWAVDNITSGVSYTTTTTVVREEGNQSL